MGNIINFETRDQGEYRAISDLTEKHLNTYQNILERKERKLQLKGSLTESDLDEILAGMASVALSSKNLRCQLERINPEAAQKMVQIEENAFNEERAAFRRNAYGITVIE